MTTASNTIAVPKWLVISGAFLVAIAVAMLIGFTIAQSQPSDADLLARAMAGDREAGETLEAKYAEPTPRPISAKEANFTPGTYKKANPDATNGAEVIASFILLAAQSKVDEAMRLTTDPSNLELREAAEAVLGYAEENPDWLNLKKGVTIGNLTTNQEELVTEGMPIVSGKPYIVRVPSFDEIGVIIVKSPTGWKIENFAGYGE